MVTPIKHDWPKIIAEIKAGYLAKYGVTLTDYKLAQIVSHKTGRKIDPKSIERIKEGAIPKEDIARALEYLHVMDSGKNTIVPHETMMR